MKFRTKKIRKTSRQIIKRKECFICSNQYTKNVSRQHTPNVTKKSTQKSKKRISKNISRRLTRSITSRITRATKKSIESATRKMRKLTIACPKKTVTKKSTRATTQPPNRKFVTDPIKQAKLLKQIRKIKDKINTTKQHMDKLNSKCLTLKTKCRSLRVEYLRRIILLRY
ncbi:hypothetical protein DOLIC_00130 [Dolichomitus sp. PSUC_FEM 10030005]|nr:hypothetical protein [Dolichomitus sp. PSUC_FEM 10030005]